MSKYLGAKIFAYAFSVKKSLRRLLATSFPVGYDMLFTHGNWDETPWEAIGEHRGLLSLMSRPPLAILLEDHPNIVYRCYRWYLAKSFTKQARRTIFKNHYDYLLARLNETFFLEISRSRPVLWQKSIGDDTFAIRLSFTSELHHEGDLQLEFHQDSVRLYHLSFTIAPGHLVGSEAAQVLLIGHVLGVTGHFDAMRHATKKCLDIAPPYLLMAAVQGICDALNVDMIAGVKNTEQITANSDDSKVGFDYDAFWRTLLGTEAEKFYLISVPIPEKPLAMISTSHRRRTRLKRQFKSDVADTSKASLLAFHTRTSS